MEGLLSNSSSWWGKQQQRMRWRKKVESEVNNVDYEGSIYVDVGVFL
jgi:hypothetical protein